MKHRRLSLYVATGLLLTLSLFQPLSALAADAKIDTKAETKTTSGPKSITSAGGVQGYTADSVIQNGSIVQLDGAGATKVKVVNQKTLNKMYGVVIDPHVLPLTVSNGDSNQIYVATAGTFDVLVSTQNGSIKSGDYVTLSALDGVAMKAGTDEVTVFGRAAADFSGKGDELGSVSLKDTTGKVTKTVTLGMVPVAIDIKANPNKKSTKANMPKFLQRLGEAVAEKPVGPLRMYLSIAITGISIVAAIIILYSGVRNSIISIGRNPLSRKSILRGLLEIVLTSIIILIIGLFAVYLLLKL